MDAKADIEIERVLQNRYDHLTERIAEEKDRAPRGSHALDRYRIRQDEVLMIGSRFPGVRINQEINGKLPEEG